MYNLVFLKVKLLFLLRPRDEGQRSPGSDFWPSSISCCTCFYKERSRSLTNQSSLVNERKQDDSRLNRVVGRSARRFSRLRTLFFLLCVVAGLLAASLGVVLGLLLSSDISRSHNGKDYKHFSLS